MPFIYRYIDLQKEEVVYVGKVTTYHDQDFMHPHNGIDERHNQHKRDTWYMESDGDNNLLLQYIQLKTHTDADILETWLIQYYDTGQLFNKAKLGWGFPNIDLSSEVFGKWKDYKDELLYLDDMIRKKFDGLVNNYIYGSDTAESFKVGLEQLECDINQLKMEKIKQERIQENRKQDDFKRCVDISDVAS